MQVNWLASKQARKQKIETAKETERVKSTTFTEFFIVDEERRRRRRREEHEA